MAVQVISLIFILYKLAKSYVQNMYLHVPTYTKLIFTSCTIQKKFVTLQRKSTVRMMKGHDI